MQKAACPSPIKTNDKGSSLSKIQDKREILESSLLEIKYAKRSPRVLKENKNVGDTTISKNEIVVDQINLPTQENVLSPERRRKKNQIENLRSDLSPKFIGNIEAVEGKRSRYGRQQKSKEADDFLPSNIAGYMRRSPSKLKSLTPPQSKFISYESPIEKLIQKNKMRAIGEKSTPDDDDSISKILSNANNNKSNISIVEFPEDDKRQLENLFEANISYGDNTYSDDVMNTPEMKYMSVDSNGNEQNSLITQIASMSKHFEKSPSSISSDSAKGSSIDSEPDFLIAVGEIFWGQISSFPYWPCIVWPDPEGRTITIDGNKTQKQHVKVHVKFFADNGRRSWVKKSQMIPFHGEADFKKKAQNILNKTKKTHPSYKPFIIPVRKRKLWEQAIEEAENVCRKSLAERGSAFEKVLADSRTNMLDDRINRRLSLNVNWKPSKFLPENKMAGKRNRSPTPESKMYEKIDDLQVFAKKRKIDVTNNHSVDKKKYTYTAKNVKFTIEENIYESMEYKKFFGEMKQFVMDEENELLESCLQEHLSQIWLLRHISKNKIKNEGLNEYARTFNLSTRRLSQRVKNVPHRRSLPIDTKLFQKDRDPEKDKAEKMKIVKSMEEVVEDIMNLSKNYLFRGLTRELVCKVCNKPAALLKCNGVCQSWIHKECAKKINEEVQSGANTLSKHVTGDSEEIIYPDVVYCEECAVGKEPDCFVCKSNDSDLGERIKCHINWCGKYYHQSCLKYWPQSKLTKSLAKIESLLCPGHVCHTCVSDDPRGKFLQIDKLKLAKCIECPATYHLDSFCIPAGTQFLTATQLICPRHRKVKDKVNVNANWCFICASGGSLICCETCPTAFHLECLKIQQPDDKYICEECETGRLPLYGELVWAKLSHFRWWPSIIIPPPEVPKNLLLKARNPNDFCVRFFGTNDHTWISRSRVFLYQEGDWGKATKTKLIDQSYVHGLKEARKISELIKAKKLSQKTDVKDKRLTPLPYIKIKSNRPVAPVKLHELEVTEMTACECKPNEESPCGPYSGCLNRLLCTECNPKLCPAGNNCQNQMFEKRIYPSLKVSRTSVKGWGLVCDIPLTPGTFIIEYVGEVIDDNEFKRRIAQKQEEKDENYYFLTLEKDYMIDAGPKGNLARFMNHSCEPNCETQKWTVNGITRIGLFAITDIPANTELTFNYNLECIGDDKKICHCGAAKCAGFIGEKYKEPEKPNVVTNNVKKHKVTNKVTAKKTAQRRR